MKIGRVRRISRQKMGQVALVFFFLTTFELKEVSVGCTQGVRDISQCLVTLFQTVNLMG